MNTDLSQLAVEMAIKNNWDEAIKLNLEILTETKDDTEALNRLSRAYFEIGDLTQAKKTTKKVLELDPSNQIALKAVEKYKQGLTKHNLRNTSFDPSIFIEEPGKTKVVILINPGSKDVCMCLNCGEELKIATSAHKVSVFSSNKYVGKLPDDVSAKIKMFIKGGNVYKAFVKSVDGKKVKIIIKEISKGDKFKNVPSFPKINSETVRESTTDSD